MKVMTNYLSKIWKHLGKKIQWYVIWVFHSKFNIGLSIIIPNSKGQVLLGKHVFSGKKPWRLLGGYINRDENIYDAAKREVKEEIGIEIEPYRVLRIRSGFAYRIEITLVTKPVDIIEYILDKKELEEVGWFDPGKEPADTLESHAYLLQLWKDQPEGYIEIKNL